MVGEILDGILVWDRESVIHIVVPDVQFGWCTVHSLFLEPFHCQVSYPWWDGWPHGDAADLAVEHTVADKVGGVKVEFQESDYFIYRDLPATTIVKDCDTVETSGCVSNLFLSDKFIYILWIQKPITYMLLNIY